MPIHQSRKQGFLSTVLTTGHDSLLEQSLARQRLVPGRDYAVFVVGVNHPSELEAIQML